MNAHGKGTNVLQYRVPPSPAPALSRPASSSAFSSACKHKHSSIDIPLRTGAAAAETSPRLLRIEVELHREQPPSEQFTIPRGVPLYPVDRTTLRFDEMSTAPTRLFIQFDLKKERSGCRRAERTSVSLVTLARRGQPRS